MLVLMEALVPLALLVGIKTPMALVINAWLAPIHPFLAPLALVLHAQQPLIPTLARPSVQTVSLDVMFVLMDQLVLLALLVTKKSEILVLLVMPTPILPLAPQVVALVYQALGQQLHQALVPIVLMAVLLVLVPLSVLLVKLITIKTQPHVSAVDLVIMLLLALSLLVLVKVTIIIISLLLIFP